ncbi:MAG TPA: universal stress protein [bacterium]|jgi:nucleotide-binding universal stress UspA family protein
MKRYLVPYDASDNSTSALKYALRFARSIPGIVSVVYIADERALSNPVFDMTVMALQAVGTLGDLIPREQAKLELKARLISRGEDKIHELTASELFHDAIDDELEISTSVAVANPPLYLAEKSREFDVIFMGLYGEMKAFKGGMWGGTCEAVIRKGESPVLIAATEYTEFKSITVGFDNRPRSRQALAWAGIIGSSMDIPVNVLTVDGDARKVGEIVEESKAILDAYDTEYKNFTESKRAPEFIIGYLEKNTDTLACLGAFGDQPVREFFLGSVAEAVVRIEKVPVMLFK